MSRVALAGSSVAMFGFGVAYAATEAKGYALSAVCLLAVCLWLLDLVERGK